MNAKSLMLAALVALPVAPLATASAAAQELRTSITQQMGGEPIVRGALQLTPDSAEWSALREVALQSRDGQLTFSVRPEGSDEPVSFSVRPQATLERPDLGGISVVDRHTGRLSAEQLEQIEAEGSVLVALRGEDGALLIEPVTVPVVITNRDEERVRTPFAAATVGRAAGERIVGDIAVVRTNNGNGQIVARASSSDPFGGGGWLIDWYSATNESQQRALDDNGGGVFYETLTLNHGSIRVRYGAVAPSGSGIVLGANTTKGDVPADLEATSPGGSSATIGSGVVTVAIRDTTLRLSSIEPGDRNPQRALRFTTFSEIPTTLAVSVSSQDTDEGFVTTTATFPEDGFGRTAITELDAEIAQLGQELGAIYVEVTYDTRPDFSVPMIDDIAPPAADGCALEVVEGARCTSPSGARLRVNRVDDDGMTIAWNTPLGLTTLPFAVASVSVQSVDGSLVLGEQRPDRAFFTASPVFETPLEYDRTSETEQRYTVEVFSADGGSLGASAGTFLPIAGLTPLLPDPLGPIRFDKGCSWWEPRCW